MPDGNDRLESWKEIAAYLGREVRTVQLWERNEGLPIRRHRHSKQGSVYAFRSELDAWRAARANAPVASETVTAEAGNQPLVKAAELPASARRIPVGWISAALCVLVLAGGVHRTLPADATVVIGPTHISDRLAPNVSGERQQGLQAHFSDQYRLYLTQMGVATEVVDIIDRNSQSGRTTQLSNKDWLRLGIVTELAL